MTGGITPRSRLLLAIGALASAVLLVLALAVGALLWSQRLAALAEHSSQLARVATGAEVGMNRTLLALDVLLATAEELLVSPATGARAPASAAYASALLSAIARQNLLVRSVVLLDDSGAPLAASGTLGAETLDLPPADFIAQALAPTVPTLVLSDPMVNTRSAERVIYAARQLRLSPERQVLAVAQVPVDALVGVLLQGITQSQVELTLERAQGELLVGLAPPQGLLERLRASGAPVHDGQALQDAGWDGRTRLHGEPGLVAARMLMYEGLWVTASMPRAAALAAWWEQARLVGAAAVALALALALAGLVAATNLVRMQHARAAVAQSKALLDQALGAMVSGFLLLDAQRLVVQWNPRFEEFFPWLAPMLRPGVPFQDLLQTTVHYHLPGSNPQAKREWVEGRLRRQDEHGPLEQRLPSGRVVQITESLTPDGGLVIVYHDVTELRQATAEVEHLAFYDPLTGLPNRRLLLQRLDQACAAAAASGREGALLFIDLDRFKTLNDTLGHEVGDLLLQQVGRRLQAGVRAGDVVARLGGDEFVVLLLELAADAQAALQQARTVAEQILALLARPYPLGAQVHHGSASIGVALFGDEAQAALEVLKQADIAMYEAKSRRGNALCFFDPSMQVALSTRAQLLADLKQALPEGQFRLHLQPQFDAAGQLTGAEALLRWQHPQRGLVAPGAFIAVAEDSELIVPIGRWVLETACALLARWQREPALRELGLSVNVSQRQFRQADFVGMVGECLAASGARAHRLELELTESLVLEDVNDSIAKMHLLRTRGVRFAVDDFGTGYSSLAYLTRLPLHRLKIDRSFVQQLGESHSDDVVVQTILGMACNLELDVVAEGVETQQQYDFLVAHGCGGYQGYLFARPMPVEDFEALAAGQGGTGPAPP
ncbi:diguanylate cyclase/phosphodiesterase [Oryzisolibacter propanilivorax]|uniref:Diguanylate cyclase/phosphodiesterase n=1 Tax=Oryzisolibacter propanilivorax TaxID=1527607 RepID=A0A1G9TQF9_9BURK|nr:EAL domain-containing protein [Oryzisolibacter propanilivorax]SDM49768.1 diguanylate cyclase/phosphodiesterase [Oryzisolibacter propanilivorax]